MAQPIRNASSERSFHAPFTPAPATTPATPPAVFVRTQQAPAFFVVSKNCHEPYHFDELSAKYDGQAIHTLDLTYSDMRAAMWLYLQQYLDKAPVLNTLNLSHTILGMGQIINTAAFNIFITRVRAMPSNLILRSCFINSTAIKPIAMRLKVDQNLQTLDLAENFLCPEDIQLLADALQRNQTLSGLNLTSNNLDTKSVQAIIRLLADGNPLRNLDLSDNLFTTEDKVALQQANAARTGIPIDLVL